MALLALVIAIGAVLRFWGIAFGLPHDLARPDEEKITRAALVVFQGDLDPHFFLYPSLYIYLTAAGYAVLFAFDRAVGTAGSVATFAASAIADPSSIRLVARVLSAACGVTTIAVLYGAARELFSTRVALAASAFLAVAFLAVRDAHFGVTDAPVTLLAVCAFWAAARLHSKGVTWRRIAVTGVVCGLAASTKYNAALVAAPAAVVIVSGTLRPADRRPIAALPALALLLGSLAIGFFAGTPFSLLDRPAFSTDFSAQSRTVLGQEHGSILDPAREVNGGEHGWTRHLTFTLRYGLGLPLLIAALGGAVWLLTDWNTTPAMVLSFPALYYAAMGISVLVYARYMVPIVPFLCLTAGIFVDRASSVAGIVLRSGRAPAICGMVLVIALGSPTAAHSIAFDRLVTKTDSRVVAARWIEDRFPSGTTLYQTGIFYGYLQPHPADRYGAYAFDERHGIFIPPGASAAALPQLVAVMDSPLVMFNHQPDRLAAALDTQYEIVATFQGIGGPDSSAADYDQQDAFYVPFTSIPDLKRPGPTVRIFGRRPR